MWWRKTRRRKRDKYIYVKRLILMALIITQLLSYRGKVISFLGKQPFVERHITALAVDGIKHRSLIRFSFHLAHLPL